MYDYYKGYLNLINGKDSLFDKDSLLNLVNNSWIDSKTKDACTYPFKILYNQMFNANKQFIDNLVIPISEIFGGQIDLVNEVSKSLSTQIKSKYALISQIFIKGISKKINKDFLVKNQEFKELIYTLVHEEYILKKEVKMTFIEPQYIHHLKLSSTNIYGISKISKSVFFCKIYLSHLLTNLMQKVIRGRD